jgi:two-component system, response regulator RegA
VERSGRGARLGPVVVVEDDPVTLAGWMELLGEAGYDVVGAASFEQGREALKSRPALLIVDVRLGAYNGLQLIIRARSDRPDLPLILVTGYADDAVRSAAELWGALYLEKPVDPDRLLSAIADALEATGERQPPSPRPAPEPPRLENERRRWARPQPGKIIVALPHAAITEKDLAWHPSLIEDGDVIVAREPADAKPSDFGMTYKTPQFRLTVRGLRYLSPRLFARYDQAILQGEAAAAERRVRLFYVDTGILILLQDHRPTRTVH